MKPVSLANPMAWLVPCSQAIPGSRPSWVERVHHNRYTLHGRGTGNPRFSGTPVRTHSIELSRPDHFGFGDWSGDLTGCCLAR